MAKAGHVNHWKHGWIPISPEARAYVAGGSKGQRPGGAAPAVTSRIGHGRRFTKVDGSPDVTFREMQGRPERPPEQYREVASVAQAVLDDYPRATDDNAVRFSFATPGELGDSVMADTGVAVKGDDEIRLNVDMWDKPDQTMATVAEMRSKQWGVFAEAADLETFRRAVITHEIGHVLHNRDEAANKNNGVSTLTTVSKGEIDKFTDEAVTPRGMGFTSGVIGGQDESGRLMDKPIARWQADTLNGQSVYAGTNKYEWWAEAFLDGTINGDKASESGKRAVALTAKVFGPKESA